MIPITKDTAVASITDWMETTDGQSVPLATNVEKSLAPPMPTNTPMRMPIMPPDTLITEDSMRNCRSTSRRFAPTAFLRPISPSQDTSSGICQPCRETVAAGNLTRWPSGPSWAGGIASELLNVFCDRRVEAAVGPGSRLWPAVLPGHLTGLARLPVVALLTTQSENGVTTLDSGVLRFFVFRRDTKHAGEIYQTATQNRPFVFGRLDHRHDLARFDHCPGPGGVFP